MNILITGVNGFIASNLFTSLSRRDDCVVFGSSRTLSKSNFIHYMPSIDGLSDWESVLSDIDVVVHVAAYVGKSNSNFSLIHDCNVEGVYNLACQAKHFGVNKFIFISSLGVYGSSNTFPICESSSYAPYDDYTFSKMLAERTLSSSSYLKDFNIIVINLPSVYHPYSNGSFSLVRKLINSRFPLPFGCISNSRSFISLDNVLEFLSICIFDSKISRQSYVVADLTPLSTSSFFKNAFIIFNRKPRLFCFSYRILRFILLFLGFDRLYISLYSDLIVDQSKAMKDFKWIPRRPFS